MRYEVDVLVAGSGGAGLTSALAAADALGAGGRVLLVESTELVGGSTSLSGGGVWIPNNYLMKEAGIADSYENARRYLDGIIPDDGPGSSPERREAYLTQGPLMVEWLRDMGFDLIMSKGYPDYYPEKPGGIPGGRCVEGNIYNLRKLGPWAKKIRLGDLSVPAHGYEGCTMTMALRTAKGFKTAAAVVGKRLILEGLIGRKNVGLGAGLVAALLKACLDRGVEVWLESPLTSLVKEGGKVTGAIVKHDGEQVEVCARCGVMLAAGGFERNLAMRRQYQEAPVSDRWTVGSVGNVGDGIRAGHEAGGALEYMDQSWNLPVIQLDPTPGADPWTGIFERSMPHGMVVDKAGKRFLNEAESYLDFGNTMRAHNKEVPCIPAYLVMDSRHRSQYMVGMTLPGMGTGRMVKQGVCVQAASLDELAEKIGVDAQGLKASAAAMNRYAETGVDEEFNRGASAYDNFYSDPRTKPNPNLGSIEKPPFYAFEIWPGDLGTMGGLLTDEHAQVVDENGTPIPGLYSAGNNAASVMGGTYAGPGSTVGPGMVFGMIGARHMVANPVV